MSKTNRETAFRNTGAVEQDRPAQPTNVAPLDAQLDHMFQDPLNKASDSGMANRGQTPEFSGEKQGANELDRDTNAKLPDRENKIKAKLEQKDAPEPEAEEVVDQDPGERQKKNQNKTKDDDLAA